MSDIADLPLSGVRVLSFEQFGAGPFATLQLADLGAEVIKVEDPRYGGDVGRTVPPYRVDGTSLFFESFNRGKRSIALDLRRPEGRETFEKLVPDIDAVFCNLRGDQAARLGLRYADLRHLNPRLVSCSLSGFGQTGPRAGEGTYDYVIQALAGWMSLTGEPDAPPTKTGLSMVDWSGGYVAAIALLGGLFRAHRTGRGCDCDISLFETALALLGYVGTWTASRDEYEPRRMPHSAHPSIVPFQAIAAADGWLVVACAKEKFWRALCVTIGRPDLLEDPRYSDFGGRHEHRDELISELETTFCQRSVAEWTTLLGAARVPCGPVNTVRAALRDPQASARGVLQYLEHPALGTVAHIASPLRVSTGVRPPSVAPRFGADTASVMREVAGRSSAITCSASARDGTGHECAGVPPRPPRDATGTGSTDHRMTRSDHRAEAHLEERTMEPPADAVAPAPGDWDRSSRSSDEPITQRSEETTEEMERAVRAALTKADKLTEPAGVALRFASLDSGMLELTLELAPDACPECLLPRDRLELIVRQMLQDEGCLLTGVRISEARRSDLEADDARRAG